MTPGAPRNVPTGAALLHHVSERIIRAYLLSEGMRDVESSSLDGADDLGDSVDLRYTKLGDVRRAAIKADPYYGRDPVKADERDLSFYRSDSGQYAFETIAHHVTREPGWLVRSDADELFYYLVAIEQPEDEVAALASEPDEVFFGELRVGRDSLSVMPMGDVRDWLASHEQATMSRPVRVGSHSAWFAIVSRDELEFGMDTIQTVGPIFDEAAKRHAVPWRNGSD
jgi:hypothetical protein